MNGWGALALIGGGVLTSWLVLVGTFVYWWAESERNLR